jgi:hypothetical protein
MNSIEWIEKSEYKALSTFPLRNYLQSATRRDRSRNVSFEPEESYYIGSRKEHPDLAVEVTITSGNTNKLAK